MAGQEWAARNAFARAQHGLPSVSDQRVERFAVLALGALEQL